MKAILEFDLENHKDQLAHNRCIKSLNLSLALWDINQLNHEGYIHATDLTNRINEIFDKYNIKLDELIE